eukprot:UN4781
MVLALNVSVYFCKLLPLHMNGNLPVGIGMHVFAMICDLIHQSRWAALRSVFFCLPLHAEGSVHVRQQSVGSASAA